jgi:type I restriction enzyme S subunit
MELEKVRIVLANKGIEEWKHVEPDDFVISLRSFQGGLEMSEVVGCITWHYIVLRACKPIYSRFFKWLFKSSAYINALQRTCNFVRDGQDLRYSNFVQVPLYEVPLDEQREIADYLDSKCAAIDTLISKKQQFIDELTAYKKSLIYEYVTGKKEVPA